MYPSCLPYHAMVFSAINPVPGTLLQCGYVGGGDWRGRSQFGALAKHSKSADGNILAGGWWTKFSHLKNGRSHLPGRSLLHVHHVIHVPNHPQDPCSTSKGVEDSAATLPPHDPHLCVNLWLETPSRQGVDDKGNSEESQPRWCWSITIWAIQFLRPAPASPRKIGQDIRRRANVAGETRLEHNWSEDTKTLAQLEDQGLHGPQIHSKHAIAQSGLCSPL